MKKITVIAPTVEAIPKKKRVAAYARVSMETERLMHSLSQQVSYYSEFIQANPRLILYPGLTIVMNVVVFNLLGDSLRDVLDPRFIKKKHHFRRMREWLNKA